MSIIEKTEVQNVSEFILGGHAEFTIKNTNSGTAYKYKVTEAKKKKGLFYVSVANGNSYEYAGFISVESNGFQYCRGRNGSLDSNTDPIKGLTWSLRKGNRPLPRPMIMLHHGKCAHCGKKLDDETSVLRGFGPVCWDRIQSMRGAELS